MPETIVVGTKNKKKLAELEAMLGAAGFVFRSIDEVRPGLLAPAETGETFEANAALKALYFAEKSGLLCLADDSGLEVSALNGAPGVHSARYAGEPSDDARNNRKLMDELRGIPLERRGADFVCVVAVARPGRLLLSTRGTCHGVILEEPRGAGGFGYDPYFYYGPLKRCFAELTAEEKHEISHRGKALRELERRASEISARTNEKA